MQLDFLNIVIVSKTSSRRPDEEQRIMQTSGRYGSDPATAVECFLLVVFPSADFLPVLHTQTFCTRSGTMAVKLATACQLTASLFHKVKILGECLLHKI